MDDEREIRDGLDRIAGELPPAGRPPQRFRHRARRRMAVSGALVGLVALALIGGSVAGLQALDLGKESGPGGVTTSVTTAASPASPAPSSPAAGPPIEHIAFQSDRSGNDDIWVMDENGDDPIDRTNDPAADQMPAWSPDGTKIAFASDRSGQFDIWVMNADGSNPVDLTNTPDADEQAPSWSPKDDLIAYLRADRIEGVALPQIWMMHPDGSGQHGTFLFDNQAEGRPSWSPDGNRVVFSRGLNRMALQIAGAAGDTQSIQQVTDGPADSNPSWCADGSPITFVRTNVEEKGIVEHGDIWRVDPDNGSSPERLTDNRSSSDPAWNPAGNVLAFAYWPKAGDPTGTSDIELMSPNGTILGPITSEPGNDRWPAWQPVAT